jgi:hypothetical protein
LIKGGVIQSTKDKIGRKQELMTMVKMQAEEFAFFEGHFSNGGLVQFGETEIAPNKMAL